MKLKMKWLKLLATALTTVKKLPDHSKYITTPDFNS